MKKKKVTNTLLLLLLSTTAYSQEECGIKQGSERFEILFELDSSVVDPTFQDNEESLQALESTINRLQDDSRITISEVKINSYASPEGGLHYNKKLTKSRTNAIYDYLTQTISVPDSIISKRCTGIDWEGLTTLVEESSMQYRDEVLNTLSSVPEETWRRVNPTDRWQTLVDSRNKHLMDLKYGRPYNYIAEHFYPMLRRGSVVTIYFEVMMPPIVASEVTIEPLAERMQLAPMVAPVMASESDQRSLRFALKTNLLYDLLLAPNVELEIPIKSRFSIAGEWIFPWWVTKDNGNALQLLSGQVEGRYWFGDRTARPQLTGWFAGLYAGGGLYDLQWKNDGYQGEFYIAAGLAGGYAHTINKRGNLRMEYSLGVGYLSTEYRYYEGMQNNEYLVWQHNGRYTWIGPTKAKVSLVWFADWKIGGKR